MTLLKFIDLKNDDSTCDVIEKSEKSDRMVKGNPFNLVDMRKAFSDSDVCDYIESDKGQFGLLADPMRKSQGEGSRGGKIIGHTKSGKPIYESAKHPSHASFTSEDHKDAWYLHEKIRSPLADAHHENEIKKFADRKESHFEDQKRYEKIHDYHQAQKRIHDKAMGSAPKIQKSQSENIKTSATERIQDSLNELELLVKGQGEGSRGGKVIGHTKSGKPIYDSADHPEHKNFTKEDHLDAVIAHHDKLHDIFSNPNENKGNPLHHKEQRFIHEAKYKQTPKASRENKPEYHKWLDTFVEEKGIDPEGSFELDGPSGKNFMSYGVVLEAIKGAPKHEQEAIRNQIVKLDFKNAKIEPYLKHLAQALVK